MSKEIKPDQPATEPPVPAASDVKIAMKRDARCGEEQKHVGNVIAVVHLEPDVSLNYLVDAVRNGFAGPVKDEPRVDAKP